MVWWLIALAIFVSIAAAIYVPDWIEWVEWNRRRKRMTPGEARDVRPPVRPPFWSSYTGLPWAGGGYGDAGGYDGGGFDGGSLDGGGGGEGGCD